MSTSRESKGDVETLRIPTPEAGSAMVVDGEQKVRGFGTKPIIEELLLDLSTFTYIYSCIYVNIYIYIYEHASSYSNSPVLCACLRFVFSH